MNPKLKKFILKYALLDLSPKMHKLSEPVHLFVRVAAALAMFYSHGWSKVMNFSSIAPHFPDPLNLSPTLSLALTACAEFFCAILLALGLLTRWASFSLFSTMMVAGFVYHFSDPFAKKELAVVYALIFLIFMILGGGKYSLDHVLKKKL